MRLLFYSHDGQGLGHVRRNLAIAGAVTRAEPTASVLVVSSSDHVDDLVVPPGVDVLKLPGVRKLGNERYEARRLRLTGAQVWALRSSLITSAARMFDPDVLLADKHPLGAHRELEDALDLVAARGGRSILGLRDVLDEPATVRAEWARGGVLPAIARHYEQVLVYGCREVLDPAVEYGMPAGLARRLRYCGYVASTPEVATPAPLVRRGDPRPVVLASAGAGTDGFALLSAFLRASQDAPWHPLVVSGSDATAEEQERLQRAAAAAGGTSRRFVRDLAGHFSQVAAVVGMGGYNTLAECLSAGVPTVVVPRVHPRQEQLLRARAFADLGLLQLVLPEQLDGPALGDAVRTAIGTDRSALRAAVAAALELDGAGRAAEHLIAAGHRSARPRPVVPLQRDPSEESVRAAG